MDLDIVALRWAKKEDLERLARSLRVVLPTGSGDEYMKHLRRRVVTAIQHDKWMAAAEQRKEMEKAEAKKLAAEIASQLGETGAEGQAPRDRVERQIALMQLAIGDDGWWIRTTANTVEACHGVRPALRTDATPRTLGGAFFAHARKQAHEMMTLGQMPRKTFYRAFCWRLPAPKMPKPPAPPKAKKPVQTAKASPGNVRKGDRRAPAPQVETYVRRRRA